MLFGVGLVGLSRVDSLWAALPVMLVTGAGMMLQMASSNTVLQTIVDEDKRGRVMSLFAMAFFGMAPLGSLLAGALASRMGAQNTILAGGLATIVAAAVFLRALPELRRVVRPIYVQMGILPEIAQGLQAASLAPQPPEP
jgi:MFS family permease